MTNPRMRMVAIASSMALSLSMVAAPAVMAQDNPEEALTGFAEALGSLDLVELPTYFCPEQVDSLGGIGLAGLTGGIPPGFEFLTDGISVEFDFDMIDIVSQSDAEAIAEVTATMAVEMDLESIMPMLTGMMEAFGATEEELAMMQEEIAGELPESEILNIAGQVTLVPGEARPWVICSELGALSGLDMDDDDMDDDDMDDDDMDDDGE
jgi:hypothetical protein